MRQCDSDPLDLQITSSSDRLRKGRLSSATVKSLQRKKKATSSLTKKTTLTTVPEPPPAVDTRPQPHPHTFATMTLKETTAATIRTKSHPHGMQRQGSRTASRPTTQRQSQGGGKGPPKASTTSIKGAPITPRSETTKTTSSTKGTRIPLPSSAKKRGGQPTRPTVAGKLAHTYTKSKIK